MKNLILTGLCSLFFLPLLSQNYLSQNLEQKCIRAEYLNHYSKTPKDIVQSPLLNDYDIGFYFLDLNVENDTTYLWGNVEFKAQVTVAVMDTFAFELMDGMPIDSILFNGTTHDYLRENDEVFVPLPAPLQAGNLFSAKIHYHGTPEIADFFSAGVTSLYDSTWNKNVTWSLSEPFYARSWWPVKQVLTDKADSVWVFITTDTSNLAGSEGLLTQVVTLGNKHRFEWKSKYPIDYYLISFAVADYQEYDIYAHPNALNGDSILIQNFIYDSPGCLEYYKSGIDNTSKLIDLFSDIYSLYPFYNEKYGHCLVPLGGGMEHQTMTTLGGFWFGLVSHELGHMWFGDNVTCATWSDIAVNESFATYSDYLAHEMIAGPPWPAIWLKNTHNNVLSEPDGSVYVPPTEVTYDNVHRIFDSRLSYSKGALVLHMIRYSLHDDDLFFMVYKKYQNQFGDSVATIQDFLEVLNSTTGENYDQFFDQWIYGEGYPIYQIDWSINNDSVLIISNQTASTPGVTPFFNMPLPIRLYFNDGTDTTIVIEQTQPSVTKIVKVSMGVDSLKVDPDLWVLKKVESINGLGEYAMGEQIQVFPNPFQDFLIIQGLNASDMEINIINIAGQSVYSRDLNSLPATISTKHLDRGIYLIGLFTKNDVNYYKFIKN